MSTPGVVIPRIIDALCALDDLLAVLPLPAEHEEALNAVRRIINNDLRMYQGVEIG